MPNEEIAIITKPTVIKKVGLRKSLRRLCIMSWKTLKSPFRSRYLSTVEKRPPVKDCLIKVTADFRGVSITLTFKDWLKSHVNGQNRFTIQLYKACIIAKSLTFEASKVLMPLYTVSIVLSSTTN